MTIFVLTISELLIWFSRRRLCVDRSVCWRRSGPASILATPDGPGRRSTSIMASWSILHLSVHIYISLHPLFIIIPHCTKLIVISKSFHMKRFSLEKYENCIGNSDPDPIQNSLYSKFYFVFEIYYISNYLNLYIFKCFTNYIFS